MNKHKIYFIRDFNFIISYKISSIFYVLKRNIFNLIKNNDSKLKNISR